MDLKFVLQIIGITEGTIINRPSLKIPFGLISDVKITKNNKEVLAYTPSFGCDGLADAGSEIFAACCMVDDYDEDDTSNNKHYTHTVFLANYKENADNEQIICINPNMAMDVMESIIEKNILSALPSVHQFKRHVKFAHPPSNVYSNFSFVGICDDNIPFIIEINNVPFAEYDHGEPSALSKAPDNRDFNTKTAYFPEKGLQSTAGLLKKIRDLTQIVSESNVRCFLVYIISRTDIDNFEFSRYNPEYRLAVRKAIEQGVKIIPIIISWTTDGVALFITDELRIGFPN